MHDIVENHCFNLKCVFHQNMTNVFNDDSFNDDIYVDDLT